ncbi:ubiquitin-protein ligase sel1 [Diplocarpon rosae]|nr:ubiquitin-protein ligase sel1 [Diplocarpon rosae]
MYTLNSASTFHIADPASTYVYDIVQVAGDIAAISSDDTLRLLDPLALNRGPVSTTKVNKDVTCLQAVGGEDTLIVATAGRDGKVCIWDPRSGAKIGEVKSDQDAPILSLAASPQYGLAAGTELTAHQASILMWDMRELRQPVVQYVESHSDDVTELQFHPTRLQILLSGSTDGLVNIFNTTITDEEDALHQTINHGSSIHHANFLNEIDVFALSHDEKFSTYRLVTNLEERAEEPLPVHYGDMREKLGGEYIANVLRRPDGGSVIGVGMHSRDSFDLIQLRNKPPWTFAPETKVTLPGAHGSEIVRTFCFLDSLPGRSEIRCARFCTMKDWSRRLWFLILHAQEQDGVGATVTADGDPQPSVAAQSPTPQQPLREQDNGRRRIYGSEQVEKALFFLRRYERLNARPSRKPSGILGAAGQYLLELMPRFSIQGPASEGSIEGHRELPAPVAEAVQLLEEAAQFNNPDAIFLLAEMNFYGNYSAPRDYSEAFRRYHQLASLDGNSSAQHMVGFMYATGIGGAVERDQAKALLYHTFAAQGGSTKSEMTVAFRYHVGIGVAQSCNTAIRHYKNVADKAIEWYRSGPPGGMTWVPDSHRIADEDGGVYGEGASYSSSGKNRNRAGVNSDANAALDDVLEYLDLMSRKGDFKATFSLGRIHYDGQKGLARNLKSAKWYFMKVAKLYWTSNGRIIDNEKPGLERIATKAAGYLGRMYLRAEGVEQSFAKAQTWFQRGIKSGDAGSQFGMGLMYLEGLGVPKNSVKATEYLKAAADQDYSPAQVTLGALYLDQGTSSDILIASKYFELAARYGHIEAFYFLAELIDQGVGRERSCGLAAAYYKSVSEKAEPLLSSFAEANKAFEEGDHELALVDYMFAAEQGYENAQANVAYLLDQKKSKWTYPSWLSLGSIPRPALLQNGALALIYWTRSAKQSNIDSLVKMGDYYLEGVGTQIDLEKAASCYTAACEYHQSAQALYNLAWMHENGVGLTQDFHLAKRYYDLALETNEEAYLPVTLSLFKLRLRSAWNTLTHGRVNSIQDEPAEKKNWSLSEWITNFLRDDHMYYGDADFDDNYLPDNDPMPGGDADGLYDDVVDDGLFESIAILVLAGALVALIWYRNQRQLAHRREREAEAAQNGANQGRLQQPLENNGLFPQLGDPEFVQWAAGGVGQ